MPLLELLKETLLIPWYSQGQVTYNSVQLPNFTVNDKQCLYDCLLYGRKEKLIVINDDSAN